MKTASIVGECVAALGTINGIGRMRRDQNQTFTRQDMDEVIALSGVCLQLIKEMDPKPYSAEDVLKGALNTVHVMLDELGIPRFSESGEKFSITERGALLNERKTQDTS